MSGGQLRDWNFEGWGNQDLSKEVQKISVGNGELARQFADASEVLRGLAGSLLDVDRELRKQLNDLGINWGGAAGEAGQQTTKVTSEGFNEAGERTTGNSDAMARQGESATTVRHEAPSSSTLLGDTQTNLLDKGADFFGFETDHAAEVAATNRARQEAIDSLNNYKNSSQGAIDSFRTPNPPPDIVVASAAVATPVGPQVGVPTGGPPGVTGGPGFTGTPGSPGFTGGVTGGPIPTTPGNTTGVLPGGNTPGAIAAGTGLPKPLGVPPLGLAATAAAAAGLAGGTAGARGAQVVGGGRGPSQAPKTPIAPTGPKGAPSTIGGGGKAGAGGAGAGGTGTAGKGVGGAMTPGGAAGVGPEAGRGGAAAAAGKAGVGGKGAGSLMSPAASGARGEGEEDGEHVRKYGVDSDEMFGDDRMVVQSVIGEDPKDK